MSERADAANGVVGPGNCNEAGFNSVLSTVDNSGGGTITFNCGTATIPVTVYKQVAHAVTIDGGGTITFDGGNVSAFFQIYSSSTTTLKRLTLQHGVMSASHALENFGVLTLDTVLMQNNSSTAAAILNQNTLIVRSSTFSNNVNTATNFNGDGGAIENDGGSATIRTSTFTSNTAGRDGGAIANVSGDVGVERSTFKGNSAARYGGAIRSASDMSVTNSTFNGNTGTSGGGAIYQDGTGASSVTYITAIGNSAPFGAGVYNDGGGNATLTITKSILGSNTTGNCDGVLQTGGYNLSSDTHCGSVFTGTGDLNSQTLSMGALASNGGPTQTMLPQAGNPAINHIPSAQCAISLDQRGAVRPSGAGCDSGALEVGGSLTDLIFYDAFE
ncbi:MAG: choice-of-anchor Q domain-containing protein [Dokdonella sp.]